MRVTLYVLFYPFWKHGDFLYRLEYGRWGVRGLDIRLTRDKLLLERIDKFMASCLYPCKDQGASITLSHVYSCFDQFLFASNLPCIVLKQKTWLRHYICGSYRLAYDREVRAMMVYGVRVLDLHPMA